MNAIQFHENGNERCDCSYGRPAGKLHEHTQVSEVSRSPGRSICGNRRKETVADKMIAEDSIAEADLVILEDESTEIAGAEKSAVLPEGERKSDKKKED
jgi:hypothetical protein